MMSLKNKKATVIGLGKSGLSAVRLLLKEGATVTATDSDESIAADFAEFKSLPVVFKLGRHAAEDFLASDLIVVSPGVPAHHPLLEKVKEKGTPLIGELELASWFLNPKVTYAITGTNGKSTATTLLGEFFKKEGKQTFMGGNLGPPASEAVLNPTKAGWEVVVLEVSSFQLETIQTFHPKMAALLNITPDHGERYAGLEEYTRAKFNIFVNQGSEDYALLNWDDPVIRKFPNQIKSKVVWFSLRESLSEGICLEGDSLYYRIDRSRTKLCEIESIPLKGSHNAENIAVAAGIAFLAGVPPETLQEALDEFKGLEHRLEMVRELHGVTYMNDSKGTNVGAVIKSLEAVQPPVILIAGGKEKGGGFLSLRPLIRQKVRTLILIGEAKTRMKEELKETTDILEAQSLQEAIRKASSISRKGDTVLLSPACSSHDMFKDYEERGALFKQLVKELV
ncbi:MAG: UDP-N-acetylmuramoyl-L-alanine--D-glutamate ligase [Nitrospiria bacterium]